MPGPTPNFDVVSVHGKYVGADGTMPSGSVVFEIDPTRLVDAAALTTIVPFPIRVELINGEFTADIPATDDPDIAPDGFTWRVTEDFFGGQIYHIEVPVALAGTGLDIADVVPADVSSGTATGITRAEFDALQDQVDTLGGKMVAVPTGTGDFSTQPDGTLWVEYN